MDVELFGHKLMLGTLRLFERRCKVSIIPGAAEISHFTYAEPEYFVHGCIGEIYVFFGRQDQYLCEGDDQAFKISIPVG
jgi:hypothetical protein